MSIPRFTADVTLPLTGGRYQVVIGNQVPERSEHVVPQALPQYWRTDCDASGSVCCIYAFYYIEGATIPYLFCYAA